MGKASRRRGHRAEGNSLRSVPAPFAARPFEGLPQETEWVALREMLPAATAQIRLVPDRAPEGAPATATVATVLPLAWPALHRTGGEILVATQSGASSGDASRDLAQALLLAMAAPEGTPISLVPTPTAETPRMQDLIDLEAPFEVAVHEGFSFWVGDADLDAEGQDSLERANESIIPTVRVEGAASAYWCVINDRTYVRWVLPFDEDRATDALARLQAGPGAVLSEESRLLGAFRAAGLLVPVWEVPRERAAADFSDAVSAMAPRLEAAASSTTALNADERRAKAGLVNRQVTLR
ncbi:MAG: DUF5926 family protein [Actinomycetota bacterium]|nr:DUF5926 family protein [Actinomycetota bacterium]